MKRIFLPVLLSLAVYAQEGSAPAPAPPHTVELPRLETVDGKVYEDLTKVKITANRISFQHAGGLASVKLDRLPESLRIALGYDSEAAAKEEERERLMEAAHYRAIAKMTEDEKKSAVKKARQDRAGVMHAVDLSRAVSDQTRYESLYRWIAAEQRQRDLRNAMDARYRSNR